MLILVSIDGPEEINDARRGKKTYKKAIEVMKKMDKQNLFFGYSTTVFKGNNNHVVSPEYVNQMADLGCIVGVYIRFNPVDENSDANMILSDSELDEYLIKLSEINSSVGVPLIDWEIVEQAHGCEAKKGHMIYIDGVTGKVAPCPKTPFSPESCNLYTNPHKDKLLEILQTEFFSGYRCSEDTCTHCSLSLVDELDNLLGSDIEENERERLAILREKLD